MAAEFRQKAASHAVQLLRTEWFLLLRTPQQRLPMSWSIPKIAPFRGDIDPHLLHGSFGPHESAPK